MMTCASQNYIKSCSVSGQEGGKALLVYLLGRIIFEHDKKIVILRSTQRNSKSVYFFAYGKVIVIQKLFEICIVNIPGVSDG